MSRPCSSALPRSWPPTRTRNGDVAFASCARREKGYADYRETLTPKRIMDIINEERDPETVVVTDVGQHQMWAAQYLTFDRPRSFITSGGLGTMGFGLGASIGAALATGRHVILVTGDGSFAMNMAELITAVDVDNQLPITVVMLDNRVLGMVRQMQSLFKRQRYSQTTLDRKSTMSSWRRPSAHGPPEPPRPRSLRPSSRPALLVDGPTFVECPIDKDEFVTPVLQIGASMDELIVNMDDVKAKMGRLEHRETYSIAIMVRNEFGVLNRVTSMFRRRQFNTRLTVSETETEDLSYHRAVRGEDRAKTQLVAQLAKLPDVISWKEFDPEDSISCELLLIKMANNDATRSSCSMPRRPFTPRPSTTRASPSCSASRADPSHRQLHRPHARLRDSRGLPHGRRLARAWPRCHEEKT